MLAKIEPLFIGSGREISRDMRTKTILIQRIKETLCI